MRKLLKICIVKISSYQNISWIFCRLEFPKEHNFPPYVPQFYSGWTPPPLLSMPANEGEDHTNDLEATIKEQANKISRDEAARKASLQVSNIAMDIQCNFEIYVLCSVNIIMLKNVFFSIPAAGWELWRFFVKLIQIKFNVSYFEWNLQLKLGCSIQAI